MEENPSPKPPPVVIELEPPRSENHSRPRVEEAVANGGESLGQWLRGEIRWGVSHFMRILLSVAIFRGIHRLMGTSEKPGVVNEKAYRSAPDLWTHGYQEKPKPPPPPPVRPMRPSGPEAPPDAWKSDAFWERADPGGGSPPTHLCTIGAFRFYNQTTILRPGLQYWPCVVRFTQPCRGCPFFVTDRAGDRYCVAREKLDRYINYGDDSPNFYELKQELRSGPTDDNFEPSGPDDEEEDET